MFLRTSTKTLSFASVNDGIHIHFLEEGVAVVKSQSCSVSCIFQEYKPNPYCINILL